MSVILIWFQERPLYFTLSNNMLNNVNLRDATIVASLCPWTLAGDVSGITLNCENQRPFVEPSNDLQDKATNSLQVADNKLQAP